MLSKPCIFMVNWLQCCFSSLNQNFNHKGQGMLTNKRKHKLIAKSHMLKPIVIIGDKGLTDSVLKEIQNALEHHELIKIKIAIGDRNERAQIANTICQSMKATFLVQMIGRIATIFFDKELLQEQQEEEKAAKEEAELMAKLDKDEEIFDDEDFDEDIESDNDDAEEDFDDDFDDKFADRDSIFDDDKL